MPYALCPMPYAVRVPHLSEKGYIFVKKNTVPKKQKFPYLVGSRWTSHQKTWGWRHFQVVNRKNEGQWVFAEMVAACDANVRFWLNAKQLKDRSLWQAGWQSTQELEELEVAD